MPAPQAKKPLPTFEVSTEREGMTEILHGHQTPEGHLEYELFGDRQVRVKWEESKKKRKNGRKGTKK
jgi:hypothetical protein